MEEIKKVPTANRNTGLLFLIATACMIMDHLGSAIFTDVLWMRIVGRIALPLFAWGIAIGAEKTRDIKRYALRLLIMVFIAQPFYNGALNHTWARLNIFATLFLGLIAVWGLRDKKEWMTVLALLLTVLVDMDYGFRGVLCILLLWTLRDRPFWLAVCFSTFCVVWGEGSRVVWSSGWLDLRLQTMAVLALPLILWPTDARLKVPKWITYAAYPAHLAVIWALKEWVL